MESSSIHENHPMTAASPTTGLGPASAGFRKHTFGTRLADAKQKLTTKHGWVGDYDYGWLCTPPLPFTKAYNERSPPFYALHDELPLILAATMGLQHALAMLAGLITPPIIFASALNLDAATSAYMISASLIGCGILSLVQMSRIRLFGSYYLGTGLISVVGTRFNTLSTATASICRFSMQCMSDGTCTSTALADGTVQRNACPEAYGKLLGTSLICSFLEMLLAFVPLRTLKKLFPPIITGTVVLLIGASLVGSSGAPSWGGGSNGCQNFPTSGIFRLCPTIFAPRPLPWASPEFIGLGFLSFISIILTEIFGSPFLKNIGIIVGLAVGCIVAGATGYIGGSSIRTAPPITFLWVHTFKISVYSPAILPMLAVYITCAVEAMGDITASAEVSRVDVRGVEFDSRIQGGILSDSLGGFFSALFTVAPLSVFAQNNGVIAITRCANITAGRWCCFFLILFGVLGKISGVFLAIPNSVLGGVTAFLFASVAVRRVSPSPWFLPGSLILSLRFLEPAFWHMYTRRDRFVLAAALSVGLGNLLAPQLFTHPFDRVKNPSSGLSGFLSSITIVLSAPVLIAGIVGVILNIILPGSSNDSDPVLAAGEDDLEENKRGESPSGSTSKI